MLLEAAKTNLWKFPNDKAKEAHHFKLVNSIGVSDMELAAGSETHFDPSTAYSDAIVYSPTLVEETISKYGGATLTKEQLTSRGKSTTAIEQVGTSAEVRNIEYFTIDGKRIASPKKGRGVMIRKTTMSDGKVVTEKLFFDK